jgi:natural product precursor
MKTLADLHGHLIGYNLAAKARIGSCLTLGKKEEEYMKKGKKLTLSKETLRTLDERDLSLVVGGDSGNHEPPHGGPNSCPNTKDPGCK